MKVFSVGGCWDRLARRYVDRPYKPRVVRLKKSQLEMGRAIGKYIEQRLSGDDDRVALMEAIGNRGGGKTHLCGGILMTALALAIPRSYQIGASITAKQNREIKQGIRKVAAPGWITGDVTDLRDPHTTFVTGSQVLWCTSKNPKALRQALLPFEHVLLNEGQDQKEVMFTNAISAIRNTGGIVTVATNPPQEGAGDWVAVLYQGIQTGNRDGLAFVLEAKDNDAVSQPTLGKIERLLRLVNPEAADRDALGIIGLSGNIGYPGFTRMARLTDADGRWLAGHVGEPPQVGWKNITRELTAARTGTSGGFDFVAGGDFQTEPGSCAVIGQFFRTPHGEVVLAIRDFVATSGVEADLTMALNSKGYFPGSVDFDGKPAASLCIIGDATGARQNAEHRKRDPYSFTRLRADGWTVMPPAYYGPKRTPWNPLVTDSRKQMKACHAAGLIMYSPRCDEAQAPFPALIESMARAKVTNAGKFEKKGHFTHGPDGVRYLAWWGLPRTMEKPPAHDAQTADEIRKIRVFSSK